MSSKDITSFLEFEPVGKSIQELETPVPVIDIDVVERNLKRWQERCDRARHRQPPAYQDPQDRPLAKYQLALGAKGITVQKLGEAEVMADAGITDMLLTFNVVGEPKLERLADLARAPTFRSSPTMRPWSRAWRMRASPLAAHFGAGRVRHGREAQRRAVAGGRGRARPDDRTTKGVAYGGLMTYARPGTRNAAEAFLNEARDLPANPGLRANSSRPAARPICGAMKASISRTSIGPAPISISTARWPSAAPALR